MKSICFASLFILLALMFAACENEPHRVNEFKPSPELKSLVQASNGFGYDFMREIDKAAQGNENYMVSPLSVSLALGMTYNGAETDTKTAFEQTLGYPDLSRTQINEAFQSVVGQLLVADPKVVISIANSIWCRDGFAVQDSFLSINKTYFDAEVNSRVFDQATLDEINAWVSDKTKGKIPEVLDYIPADAVMYLINAIYFKGTWKYQFDKKETVQEPFYPNNAGWMNVATMKMKALLPYYSDTLLQAVRLPYGGENFSMTILLPAPEHTTSDVVTALNASYWKAIEDEYTTADSVQVYLPKFRFKTDRLLNDVLSEMGLGIAFSPQADFSGINPDADLMISRVIHSTFVEVNEEGTEAAAVTVVEIVETSMPEDHTIHFRVNRPFIFFITEMTSGAILFQGRVQQPVWDE